MKRLVEEKKINPSIDALQKITQSLTQIASSRQSLASSLAELPSLISSLLESSDITLERFQLVFTELYSQLQFIYREYSSIELNASSDYGKLVDNFNISAQINEAYIKIKDEYSVVSNKLIEAEANDLYEQESPSYSKKKAGLQKAIKLVVERKKAKNEELKKIIDKLIIAKTSYNKFKGKTLQQIWVNYITGFKQFREEKFEFIKV